MVKIVKDELTELMGGDATGINLSGNPTVILMSGLQGSGKTTFSGKLANYLKTKKGKKPLLGICYGAQYLVHFFGGKVGQSSSREYGRANLSYIDHSNELFDHIEKGSQVWMSHSDTVKELPTNGELLASTHDVENAAFKINGESTFAIQFHPEVYHSKDGKRILENFLINIAKINPDWTPDVFSEKTISEIKEIVGDDKVILGLSGGVDSTVAAVLLHKAIGENLYCVFVNNGLLRKNEFKQLIFPFH